MVVLGCLGHANEGKKEQFFVFWITVCCNEWAVEFNNLHHSHRQWDGSSYSKSNIWEYEYAKPKLGVPFRATVSRNF